MLKATIRLLSAAICLLSAAMLLPSAAIWLLSAATGCYLAAIGCYLAAIGCYLAAITVIKCITDTIIHAPYRRTSFAWARRDLIERHTEKDPGREVPRRFHGVGANVEPNKSPIPSILLKNRTEIDTTVNRTNILQEGQEKSPLGVHYEEIDAITSFGMFIHSQIN